MFNKTTIFALATAASIATTCALGADAKPRIDISGVNAQPPYPATALQDRESGSVLLAVGVDEKGAVTRVSPVRTSGFDDLDAAAINGVLKWKFVPATKDNKAAAGETLLQIAFQPPADGSSQPEKPGVAADYISQDFTIEAGEGMYDEKTKQIPCANGSIAATMQFIQSNDLRSAHWLPAMMVSVDLDDSSTSISAYQPYYGAKEEILEFSSTAGGAGRNAIYKFHVYPKFGKTAAVTLSWTDYGLVSASIGDGAHPQIKLPKPPSKIAFSVSGGAGRFTNAHLICTPPS